MNMCSLNLVSNCRRLLCNFRTSSYLASRCLSRKILGIETSCDDTGVAILTEDGTMLANAINSQTTIHVQAGGINPPVARNLHRQNIEDVVNIALKEANMTLEEIDILATTVTPGLSSCLKVGLDFSKKLISQYNMPFMPIHHMQAHALMPRFEYDVPFPFLVLLMSGGHCLLAVAKQPNEFLLLGQSLDDAPGEAFDKVARRLRLKDHPECEGLSGGRSIEKMAALGDPNAYPMKQVLTHTHSCDFSFSGIKAWAIKCIESNEISQGLPIGTGHLKNLSDFCASFQYIVFSHIAKKLQRALIFCKLKGLLPTDVTNNLVISGGVASNMFARKIMSTMCSHYNCNVVCPPPHLCTDNGLMIAWNALELLRVNEGIVEDPFSVEIQARCPIGTNISSSVLDAYLKLPRIKLL